MTIGYLLITLCFTVLIAYYFYRKSREKIELKIFHYNDPEVSKLSDENRKISVKYGDQIVDRITTTRVWFWNNGARPLKCDDIPPYDPLTIIIDEKDRNEEIMILDYNIVKTSRGCANFNVIPTNEKNRLKLNFDYVDSKEGVAFEIQHTGTVECILKLDGVILGPKTEPNIHKSPKSFREARNPSAVAKASKMIGLLATAAFILIIAPIIKPFVGKLSQLVIVLMLLGSLLLVSIVTTILALIIISRISKPPYPDKLELL